LGVAVCARVRSNGGKLGFAAHDEGDPGGAAATQR
jgi:hypothetical protein